jgi:hypothetical protein
VTPAAPDTPPAARPDDDLSVGDRISLLLLAALFCSLVLLTLYDLLASLLR